MDPKSIPGDVMYTVYGDNPVMKDVIHEIIVECDPYCEFTPEQRDVLAKILMVMNR